jgi:arginase family enzyme
VILQDAHADINTPLQSPSGNMHGMPVAFAMGMLECPSVAGAPHGLACTDRLSRSKLKTLFPRCASARFGI